MEQGEPVEQLLGSGGSSKGSVHGEAVEVGDGGGIPVAEELRSSSAVSGGPYIIGEARGR
jgi:hypothetical protein